jgi:hypothetical protein
MPETPDRPALAAAFARQARVCAGLDSPLYADLLGRIAADIAAGGPFADVVDGWTGDPARAFLPVRVAGTVHRLALEGAAPEVARHLPSLGGTPEPEDLWRAVHALAGTALATFRADAARAPQTNAVTRAAALLGGFLTVAQATGLPLVTREIGASAGLVLRWDRYRYETDAFAWGDPAAPVTLKARWHGAPPPLTQAQVIGRRGCDLAPIDVTDAGARLRLESFVWPDQVARFRTLHAALADAAADPPAIDRAAAADWLADQLAARPDGAAFVLHHSYVWPYLAAEERARIVALLADAGAAATPARPLAWLRLEDRADGERCEVRLTLWPDGVERHLADCHPHGRWVSWIGT